jgi:hypothetical protein
MRPMVASSERSQPSFPNLTNIGVYYSSIPCTYDASDDTLIVAVIEVSRQRSLNYDLSNTFHIAGPEG